MILKRVKFEKYDEFVDSIGQETFFSEIDTIRNKVEEISEDVQLEGRTVMVDIDENEYLELVSSSSSKGESSIKIAQKLYKDFVFMGKNLPSSLMYEKEFWTYMNIVVFFNVIEKKYFDAENSKTLDRIKRYYCNDGGVSKIDRTGLRHLWVLANSTYYDSGFDLLQVAWDYIDPFKALQESLIGYDHNVLKAFALAIKKSGPDTRIRNSVNKTRIPKHIRNFACLHSLESYMDIEKISEVLLSEMQKILEI